MSGPSGERSSRPVWLGEDKRQWDHVRVHLQIVRDPRLDAYTLAVYLGLAAHAETQSGRAWPSMDTLAGYGGMSSRKAAACISVLVETGYIAVQSRPGKASHYHLLPPPPMHTVQGSEGPDPSTTSTAPPHTVPSTLAHGADEQESVNESPKQEPDGQLALVRDLDQSHHRPPPVSDFDQWWVLYPHKVAKKEASAAYRKARKTTSAEVLTEGLRRSVYWWKRTSRPVDKMPNPASWLNGERWNDDLTSPAATEVVEH